MKPKLYQYAACPFCNKVSSMLSYKGIDHDVIEVHPLKKKEIAFSLDYRAVPIYIDGSGRQVNDSTPIMRHIDAEFPDKPVFERDGAAKAEEDRWLAWSEGYVQGLPTVIYGDLGSALESFDYVTKVGKFSWSEKLAIKYSGAFIMTLVAKKIKKRRDIKDPQAFLRTAAAEWVGGLRGREFMGNLKPNGADLAVYGITRVVAGLRAGRILRSERSFWSWYERMSREVQA